MYTQNIKFSKAISPEINSKNTNQMFITHEQNSG